jgi:ATP-binding cassette subfamily B protein
MEKQQKKRTALSWVVEFAGQKRSNYILSVLLAMMKVICGLMPYVYMADIVDKLLKMHSGVIEKDMGLLTASIVKMAVFWLLCRICHALSTTLSHAATFEVLANIRRQLTEKLSKIPLGSVLSQSSGTYKNIICERVDSI